MAIPGETAHGYGLSPSASGRLTPVPAFGANPGQLQMLAYAPAGLEPGRPVVVVLHGCTQTAQAYAEGAGWLTLADRYGFAVVCPQQQRSNNANLCFNWFEPGDVQRGHGEAASIRSMVEYACRQWASDRGAVFVTGLSAGGAMASVMLATYPEVFAGGGIIAGLPYGAAEGMQQAFAAMFQDQVQSGRSLGDRVRRASGHKGPWPKVSVWHGQADTTVKPSNASGTVAQWADVHGLDLAAASSRTLGRRTVKVWSRDGAPVLQQHLITGLGHGTPLASQGPDGAGKPGPFLLEAGVSSSQDLLEFWGVAAAPALDAANDRPATDGRSLVLASAPAPRPRTLHAQDLAPQESKVGAVINKALRAAGLL